MAEIKAVIFDQDVVIIDTERDGHRVEFNKTFKEFGFDIEWSVDKYQAETGKLYCYRRFEERRISCQRRGNACGCHHK